MANVTSRSWFVVFNNPADHGYQGTPQEVCERLKSEWGVTDGRSGAWAYCVKHYNGCFPVCTEDGAVLRYQEAITDEEKEKIEPDLHHIHMVLEDEKPMRFSHVRKTYAIGSHFEPTKGSKEQAEDYIAKTGAYSHENNRHDGLPWEEIIYVSRLGEIRGKQGQRSDIQMIGKLINEGLRPRDIMEKQFSYYRYEKEIRRAYFDKRDRDTPNEREVKVIWHTGDSGVGKSYSRFKLMEEVGEDNVYYLTDYEHGFDNYAGEPYLWMEDFKGELKFGLLLRLLDRYKCELPCRYANGKALWQEVHITSIFHPQKAYAKMVAASDQSTDLVKQLLRRISVVRYHFKGGFDTYEYLDFDPGITWQDMYMASLKFMEKQCEEMNKNWKELDGEEDLPF